MVLKCHIVKIELPFRSTARYFFFQTDLNCMKKWGNTSKLGANGTQLYVGYEMCIKAISIIVVTFLSIIYTHKSNICIEIGINSRQKILTLYLDHFPKGW